jgi:succinate dehydrogenase / fumarate reductase membrane anchor subunit
LWFVASVITHTGSDYAGFVTWLRGFPTTILVILLLIALFHHGAHGLQVVVEDYVHSGLKFAAVVTIRLGCFAIATTGILATLHIAWGL